MEVTALNEYADGTASYIEDGLVRRELSDNFVYYSPDDYESLESAAGWARESLELRVSDKCEYLYSWEEFENGMIYDDWRSVADLQLLTEGKMHRL